MKRVIFPALIILLLLPQLPNERSAVAQEEPVIDFSALKWQVLSPTAAKTDLGGKLPEVVILKVSNEQFMRIYPNKEEVAKAYLDGLKVFKRPLIKVVFCDVYPTRTSKADWLVISPHTTHSTASITAWQLSKEEPVSK